MPPHPEILLIGSRSGAGLITVAWEVSELRQAVGTAHCLIEGDYMGQVHPAQGGAYGQQVTQWMKNWLVDTTGIAATQRRPTTTG